MKSKNLWILFSLVAIVIGYSIWDYRQDQASEQKKEDSKIIATFNPSEVQSVKIKSDNLDIEIKKDGNQWKISKPIEALADQSVVDEFIKGISTEKSAQTLDGEQELKNFGLEKPMGHIDLMVGAQNFLFEIGSIKSYNGDNYLLLNKAHPVKLVSSTWGLKLEKKLFDFRDKRLLQKKLEDVKKISVQALKVTLNMVKKKDESKSNEWHLATGEYKLSQSKVSEALGVFFNSEINEFTLEKNEYSSGFKKLSLGSSLSTIRLDFENDSYVFKLYKNKNADYFIESVDQKALYKVSENFYNLFSLTSSSHSFRSSTQPFEFEKEKIKVVQIRHGNEEYVFKKADNTWTLQNPQPKVSGNSERVSQIINAIANWSVTSFSSSNSFLKTPSKAEKVEFFDESQKLVASYIFADKLKEKVDGVEQELIPVKSSIVKNIFYIKSQQQADLKIEDVVKREGQ